MTSNEKYAAARAALEKRGFAKQAAWPELLLAIVETADEIARRIAKETDAATS